MGACPRYGQRAVTWWLVSCRKGLYGRRATGSQTWPLRRLLKMLHRGHSRCCRAPAALLLRRAVRMRAQDYSAGRAARHKQAFRAQELSHVHLFLSLKHRKAITFLEKKQT